MRARREMNEATSVAEENPVNEDMDMDELLKNWKTQNIKFIWTIFKYNCSSLILKKTIAM